MPLIYILAPTMSDALWVTLAEASLDTTWYLAVSSPDNGRCTKPKP